MSEAARHGLAVDGPELKRPLGGLPEDHPHPDLTRHKHLALTVTDLWPDRLRDERAPAVLASYVNEAAPVVEWLTRHVGPSGS